jgi:hypothetical protein
MSTFDVIRTKEEAIAHAKTINNLEHRYMFCAGYGIPFQSSISQVEISRTFEFDKAVQREKEFWGY